MNIHGTNYAILWYFDAHIQMLNQFDWNSFLLVTV